MVGAFDIGGTKTIVGVVGEDGSVMASRQFPTDTADCEAHLRACIDCLTEQLCALGLNMRELSGIGITLPGIVDTSRGTLVHSAYPAWNGYPLSAYVKEHTRCGHVAVENDVNACALAEMRFGYGDRFSDFIWVTVSTGVGGAVVCGGRLIPGAGGFAGEIGHIRVEYEHPLPCPTCGGVGCLEAHGSGKAMDMRFANAVRENPELAEALKTRGLNPDGRGCAALARLGNPEALACCEAIGTYLGRGFAAAVNLLNPQALILGGGVSESLPLLKSAILRTLRADIHPSLWPVELLKTRLGYQAAFIGAATLAMERSDKQ